MDKKITGIIPPVVTPFDEDGAIDFKKFEALVQFVLGADVDGVSVGGSTGEGPTLSDEELVRLIGVVKPMLKPTQSLVCGIMRACTRDAVKTGLCARDAGADAVMVTPTAYNVLVPDEEGNFTFYKTISDRVDIPVIIYNVIPQNTISPGLFKRLVDESEHVMGIKQSVGGIASTYQMLMSCKGKGTVFGATDDMLYSTYELGAKGAISAILSVFPELCVRMWKLYLAGNNGAALELQNKIYEPWQTITGNQFPIRVKYALKLLGHDAGFARSPIVSLSDEEKSRIGEALRKI